MQKNNRISAELDAQTTADVMQFIAAIKDKLKQVLLFNLTVDERLALTKMGDKTMPFVSKAMGYATQNPEMVPNYLDLPEASKDLALVTALQQIRRELAQLHTAVDDTITVAGSEAYEAALLFYSAVKVASRSQIPGTQAVYADLYTHFSKPKAHPAPPEEHK